jgi:hypothetical protein
MKRHAHLVGSVGLQDAETVFVTVSEILGSCCPRIPDGETGARGYWIRWQRGTFASHRDFAAAMTTRSLPGFKDAVERTFFRLKDGVDPTRLEFGDLGYADEALKSYNIFARLLDDGTIPADTRFQVALPTPMALLCGFVVAEDRRNVEPAIERAMIRDLDHIQKMIPMRRLSIQWDVCYEVVGAEGGLSLPYENAIDGSVERVVRLCSRVVGGVELGIHLCYGDPGHKHIVEPKDLQVSVAFANGIGRGSPRQIDFVHMPVPRDRADAAYFAPLKNLDLPATARLILGLVHYTDGVAGSRKRMAAAQAYVTDFDVATECGFGRRDPATIPELLRFHKKLCDQ